MKKKLLIILTIGLSYFANSQHSGQYSGFEGGLDPNRYVCEGDVKGTDGVDYFWGHGFKLVTDTNPNGVKTVSVHYSNNSGQNFTKLRDLGTHNPDEIYHYDLYPLNDVNYFVAFWSKGTSATDSIKKLTITLNSFLYDTLYNETPYNDGEVNMPEDRAIGLGTYSCRMGDISSEGTGTFMYTAPRIHTTEVIDFFDLTINVQYTLVGTEDKSDEASISLISKDNILEILNADRFGKNAQISIFNLNGEEILKTEQLSDKISTQNFSTGIYILKINDNQKIYTQKFLVE
jgi:hypothetical protein